VKNCVSACSYQELRVHVYLLVQQSSSYLPEGTLAGLPWLPIYSRTSLMNPAPTDVVILTSRFALKKITELYISQLEAHLIPKWGKTAASSPNSISGRPQRRHHADGCFTGPGAFWKCSSNNNAIINGCPAKTHSFLNTAGSQVHAPLEDNPPPPPNYAARFSVL
jgi:hypothetical protein